MKAGAPKVSLHRAVFMEYVVVHLTRPVVVCKVNEPVSPAIRVVYGERADVRCASFEIVKYDPLHIPKPVGLADKATLFFQCGIYTVAYLWNKSLIELTNIFLGFFH